MTRAGWDLADPRDVYGGAERSPEELERIAQRNREEATRWEAERVDGPTGEPETFSLADALGVTKRETAEDLPASIPGEAVDALLGRPPRYVSPGPTVEEVFAQEAENRARRERLLGGFDAIAKRKEAEAREREEASR
jgi:hypothetical protein